MKSQGFFYLMFVVQVVRVEDEENGRGERREFEEREEQ